MIRRLTNNKGAVAAIILVAVLVVIAIVAVVGFLTDGFGLGGGQGDGEGEGNVSDTQSETDVSQPVIEELDFLNVTVSENEYLYQNSRLQLDELIDRLVTDAADTKVKITDENASKRAYEKLIAALEENKIHYIEG